MWKQKNYQILSMLVWFIVTFVKMVAFFSSYTTKFSGGNAALNGLVIKKVGEIKVSVKRVAVKTKNSEDRRPV